MTPLEPATTAHATQGANGLAAAVAAPAGGGVASPPIAPVPPAGVSAIATVRKYFKIFRVTLIERMTYRGDFLLGTLLRFIPMVTTILLWQAVYDGAALRQTSGGAKTVSLGGFSYREMIAYLLLTHISRMFSSMPGLAGGIAREIRDGSLKKYLLQPLDMVGYLVSYRFAHKAAYIATSALPYGLVFFLCRSYFDAPSLATLALWLVSLVLAFFVGFFFEACVGMVAFWFLEVTSLLYIVMTLNFFISGHMLPLDLLPKPWSTILESLPFQYMAYYPAALYLGKVKGSVAQGLLIEAGWALAFALFARFLYKRGVRRYSAFGG